jgi:hypothetical protein
MNIVINILQSKFLSIYDAYFPRLAISIYSDQDRCLLCASVLLITHRYFAEYICLYNHFIDSDERRAERNIRRHANSSLTKEAARMGEKRRNDDRATRRGISTILVVRNFHISRPNRPQQAVFVNMPRVPKCSTTTTMIAALCA